MQDGARHGYSMAVDVDNRPRESVGSFLRQIVADSSVDSAVRVGPRKLLRIVTWVGMGSAIGVALERDCRHRDHWSQGQALLQRVVPRLACRQAEPPTI